MRAAGAAAVHVREFDADDLASHGPLVASIVAEHGPIGTAVLAFGILGDQARAEIGRRPRRGDRAHRLRRAGQPADACWPRRCGRPAPGTIVVFSSVAGVRVRRANYVYGSAKAGLDGFASGLADALHGSGVRLLIVRPGFVIGRMTEGMTARAVVEHPAAGRRGDRAGVGQGPPHGVGAAGAAAVGLRDAAAAAVACGEGCRGDRRGRHRRRRDGRAGAGGARRIGQGHSRLRVATPTRPARRHRDRGAAGSGRHRCCPHCQTLLDGTDGDVHVVASGDPLLHGVGATLIRLFGAIASPCCRTCRR